MLHQKISKVVLGVALAGIVCSAMAESESPPVFNTTQEQAISNIVEKTLINKPEIVMHAIQSLQKKQALQQQADAINFVVSHYSELTSDPNTPVIGSSTAKVTVVEIFDYQCVYCHKMYPAVAALAQNSNVRVVFKDLPIFGEQSAYAAAMSLASFKQGKFEALHNALFQSGLMEGKLTIKDVDRIAKKAGVDLIQAKADMKNPMFKSEIQQNFDLAKGLNLKGTPYFVVMPTDRTVPDFSGKITVLPGLIPDTLLQGAIDKAMS